MINVTTISLDQVINHERSDYNPRIWVDTVNRYAKRDAKFYTTIEPNSYGYRTPYAVYMVDGFRVIQEVSYSGSLTSAPMQSYFLTEDKLITKAPYRFAKDSNGRKLAQIYTSGFDTLMVGDILGL